LTDSSSDRALRRAVVVTFPLAFAAHDLEEVLAAARWSENAAARLTRRHPRLGRALAVVLPISTEEMAIAVGVVAAGVGCVTAASLRHLEGDLRLFQAALAAFSAHSLGHLGASVVFRGYTPGIATVPTVIVPYSLWARRRLRRAGTFTTRTEWFRAARAGAGLAVAAALLGHVLARATTASAGRLRL
jgi:hypothetical protein